MKRRILLARLLAVLLCLFLVSCARGEARNLENLEKRSFRAELEGVLCHENGKTQHFSAQAEVDRRGGEEKIQITYLAPAELEGITVTVLKNRETGEELVTASLGALSAAVSHEAVKGWLLPIEALLSPAKKTPERLQKTAQGYRFDFSEGESLTVDENGLPLSLNAKNISLSVRNIQALE